MSLGDVHERRVFDDATTDARRASVYVSPRELGTEGPAADVELMRLLAELDPPQRVQIVGPSGAGKTSLIVKVARDLARRNLDATTEVLVLRVGDSPESLTSPDTVMKLVLDTIAFEGHRFSNVDPQVLQAASADQLTRVPAQVEHRGGITAPVVDYSVALREAYETAQFGQSPARSRRDLEDVLRHVRDAGHRPVLVLDDTEKFVAPGPGGEVDLKSVENLYHHGVRALGELELDLVVAMHPRFEDVSHVTEVVDRLGMGRIDVPALPAQVDPPALRTILERRLRRGGLADALDDVISPNAVEELQTLYHERDRDLRSVLKLAHAVAEQVVARDAARVEARDVRASLAAA